MSAVWQGERTSWGFFLSLKGTKVKPETRTRLRTKDIPPFLFGSSSLQQNQDACPILRSEALHKCFPHRLVLLGPISPGGDCLPDMLFLSNRDTPAEHSGLPGAVVVVGAI